jgi:aspartate racemase
MTSASHLGIVGVSPEGAALFFQQVVRSAGRCRAPHDQPRISIHNEPLALYLDALRRGDWHAVAMLMRRSAELLTRCGASIIMSPDNVVQHAIPLAEVSGAATWLTMTDLVATRVAADGRKAVGILGTKMVTSASTYQTHLGLRGVKVLAPDEHDAETLDQIIFGELLYGQIRPESRLAVIQIIANLASRGCEGVILACSEAPMIVTGENSPLPVYDSGEILADAAVRSPVPRPVA